MRNGHLSIVFSIHGTGGSPTGIDPENRLGDQDTGSPGKPVSSGFQVPGEQEQHTLGDFPRTFFLQNVLQLTRRNE